MSACANGSFLCTFAKYNMFKKLISKIIKYINGYMSCRGVFDYSFTINTVFDL